jgi:D-alanyl-D-alanine carboxypeptidase
MTPSLKRFVAGLCGFALSTAVATLLLPGPAQAQHSAAKARPTPSGKSHHALHKGVRTPSPWVPNPAVTAKDAYLIVDAQSGRELSSDQPDELRHPASLTKLMTLYLTFSALDAGKLSLNDALHVSMNALNAPPTKMGMQPNGTVLVRDAVMGLVTRSANDAAVLLAEALGGSEESFAAQMTRKARQLGMASTVYRNASGLPNPEQVTTARDMARLANALLRDFPHYYPVFSVLAYNYRGRSLENHNRMLASYAGADGLKTGYTNASGFNLVMSAVRDNRRLIGVVMGGHSASQRDKLMAELMDQGFVTAQQTGVQPWTSARVPASARYTAANFVPGIGPLDGRGLAGFGKSDVTHAVTAPASIAGSWVIQVGSFAESRAAQAALERATGALPDAIRSHGAVSIDEVQVSDKTLHRARLTNLSQQEAVDGCKKLSARKIHCSALQISAR